MDGPEAARDRLLDELRDLLARHTPIHREPAAVDVARCLRAQWQAVAVMALRSGMSASGLARRAGLHSTALNRSKRSSDLGTLRNLRFSTLARLCAAAGVTLGRFVEIYEDELRRDPGSGRELGAHRIGD